VPRRPETGRVARKATIVLLSVVALAGVLSSSASARDLSRLVAPTSACADQTDLSASARTQERAMRCMTNFARQRAGLHRFGDAAKLDRSAEDKASDILRCDSFSHYACGRQFTYWMGRVGYLRARCWRAGENIAWGAGSYGDVRSIFTAWVHSPEHLANILGRYGQIGIGLDSGRLGHRSAVRVWTQHFGSHCGAARHKSSPRGVAKLAQARGLR
jgi:uncharacterized protein YkwD